MKNLQMYINGKFTEGRSGKWIDVLNPSTEEVVSRQPDGTVEDVAEAVDAAYAAQKSWAKIPACERAVYLHKMADGIRANFDKFQEILVREQGKTQALPCRLYENAQAAAPTAPPSFTHSGSSYGLPFFLNFI